MNELEKVRNKIKHWEQKFHDKYGRKPEKIDIKKNDKVGKFIESV